MIEPTKYVLCSTNCKYPAFTAEEVLALLQYAIDNKSLEGIASDTGFITKLKEINSNKAVKLWLGTQAEYAALETKEQDTLYIFTDDSTSADLEAIVNEAKSAAEAAQKAVELLRKAFEDGTCTAYIAATTDFTNNSNWQTLTIGDGLPAGTYEVKGYGVQTITESGSMSFPIADISYYKEAGTDDNGVGYDLYYPTVGKLMIGTTSSSLKSVKFTVKRPRNGDPYSIIGNTGEDYPNSYSSRAVSYRRIR